jgi:hypothetical protein
MSDDFPPFPPPNQGRGQGQNDWAQQPDMRPPAPHMRTPEPLSEEEIGRTVLLYRVYAGALLVVYALIAVLFVVLAVGSEDAEIMFQAAIVVPFTLGFSVFQAITMWMPRKKWAWISGMVVLGFGISSCCLPFALPLFLKWAKPGFKAAFEQ